jgi:hypothetical protein
LFLTERFYKFQQWAKLKGGAIRGPLTQVLSDYVAAKKSKPVVDHGNDNTEKWLLSHQLSTQRQCLDLEE